MASGSHTYCDIKRGRKRETHAPSAAFRVPDYCALSTRYAEPSNGEKTHRSLQSRLSFIFDKIHSIRRTGCMPKNRQKHTHPPTLYYSLTVPAARHAAATNATQTRKTRNGLKSAPLSMRRLNSLRDVSRAVATPPDDFLLLEAFSFSPSWTMMGNREPGCSLLGLAPLMAVFKTRLRYRRKPGIFLFKEESVALLRSVTAAFLMKDPSLDRRKSSERSMGGRLRA